MLQMLHDNVLIKADEQETEIDGFYTGSATDKPCTGTAVSVGPGRYNQDGIIIEHGIKQGDKVVFGASAMSQPHTHEGEKYFVMLAGQIFGVQR